MTISKLFKSNNWKIKHIRQIGLNRPHPPKLKTHINTNQAPWAHETHLQKQLIHRPWKQILVDFCQSRPQKPICKNLRVGLWEIICHRPKHLEKIEDWQIRCRIITCQMERARSIILESWVLSCSRSMQQLIPRSSEQCQSIWEQHLLGLTRPCKLQTTYKTFHLQTTLQMDWLLRLRKKWLPKGIHTIRKPTSTHRTNKRYSSACNRATPAAACLVAALSAETKTQAISISRLHTSQAIQG